MNSLPDEMLIEILKDSFNDPSEILINLRLVCKRWNRILADECCWSKADISFQDFLPSEAYKHLAVTLMKAPRLRALTVTSLLEGKNKETLIQCLQRCSLQSKKISRIYLEIAIPEVFSHAASFLFHQNLNELKVLTLRIYPWNWPSSQTFSFSEGNKDICFFGMIWLCKRLQELNIHMLHINQGTAPKCTYKRPPSGCCPPLKKITVHNVHDIPGSWLQSFVKDIMLGTSQTLEYVDMNLYDALNSVPSVLFPNLSVLSLGTVHDPLTLPIQNVPKLECISLTWLLSSCANAMENIKALLRTFSRCCQINILIYAWPDPQEVDNMLEVGKFLESLQSLQSVPHRHVIRLKIFTTL